MKNDRMITRTIVNSSVTVKVYNEETDELTTTTLEITGKFSNDELLKRCENRLTGSNLKVLKIINLETTEKLYGVSEAAFMAIAVEIPPRTVTKEEA